MIQAAKQQRDEIVRQAELMHDQVVSEIDEMMDGSIEHIDTGRRDMTDWSCSRRKCRRPRSTGEAVLEGVIVYQ